MITNEALLLSVGRLVRASASYDQWLWKVVGQLRQGRDIKANLESIERDNTFAERVDDAPLKNEAAKTRRKLIRHLLDSLQPGSATAERIGQISGETVGPMEIRNVVAHWDLSPVGDVLIASSFAATEDLRDDAADLVKKYRKGTGDLPKMAAFVLKNQEHSIPLTLHQIDAAAKTLQDLTDELRGIAAQAAVSYMAMTPALSATEARPGEPERA